MYPSPSVLQTISCSLIAVPSPYSSVLSPDRPVKNNITHHIETTGLPVVACPRRLATDRFGVAKQEFDHMMQFGII